MGSGGSPMVLSCLGPVLRAPAPSTLCYTGAPLPDPWVETSTHHQMNSGTSCGQGLVGGE